MLSLAGGLVKHSIQTALLARLVFHDDVGRIADDEVEQMRGTAINQVAAAELALVTGGPASLPVSGLILGRTA